MAEKKKGKPVSASKAKMDAKRATEDAANKKTMAYRQGKGRLKADGTKSGTGTMKGSKKVVGSGGTRSISGHKGYDATGRRKTGVSSRVVKEKKASAIKKQGVKKGGSMKAKAKVYKGKKAYGN